MALHRSEGVLRVGLPETMEDATTRSHLADGRVIGWFGDPGIVIDAELTGSPIPPALAARYGREDFWPRWTRAEVAAKLADVPIILWVRQHGLTSHRFEVSTLVDAPTEGVVVSLGRAD